MANAKTATSAQLRAAFLLLAAVAPFKAGDTVKVLRSFETKELGCDCYSEDDGCDVGKELKVTSVVDKGEYELDDSYVYPFFCLQLVRAASSVELNDDYTAVVSDDGKTVTVGCQEIDSEKVIELALLVKKVQASQPAPKPKKKAVRYR